MLRTISKDFRIFSSLTILFVAVLIGSLWAFFDFISLQQHSQTMRQHLLSDSENQLRERVQRAVSIVEFYRQRTEEQLKKEIKSRTYEACAIASGLVARHQDHLTPDRLRQVVLDSLRSIRYNGGRGYFFAINMDGTEELFPAKSHFKRQEIANIQDSNGQFVIKDMLALARRSGEGFYSYTFSKPGSERKDHIKISFVKYLPELDWIIGTGEYVEDVEQDLQQDVLQRFDAVRPGPEDKSYLFVGTWDGLSLTKLAKGRNMLEIQDANGLFVVKELINQAKSGGGFVRYVMPRFKGQRPAPKLSYVVGIPEWRWYIGTGEYIDNIEAAVLELYNTYRQNLQNHFLYIAAITLAVLLLNLYIANYFAAKLQRQARRFVDFFQQAAATPVTIDESSFPHDEFRSIGSAANTMLDERNRALRQVQGARDQWVKTFNAIQDAILFFDQEGTCIQANRTAEQLFSEIGQETIGHSYTTFLCEENLIQICRRDLQPHHDYITTLQPGKIFFCSSYPLLKNGQLDSAIYILSDVTKQKGLEAQLAQSQRLESVGRLAGGVAHDFNNILSAIIGNAELCQFKIDKGNPLYERLDLIKSSGHRAARLTRQLLAFSRREIIKPEIIDFGREVHELNKMLVRLLGEHIEIKTRIQDGLWPVKMDRGQLEQILINLAVNGRDAMPNGGLLSIELTNTSLDTEYIKNHATLQSGDYVMLGVTDTGSGMESEVVEHIFEPFYTTKEQGKGTGLGLATVHGITKQNGGEIYVYSEPGKGTAFKVYLPRCTDEDVNPAAGQNIEPEETIEGGSEVIIIVEDDSEVRNMLASFLSSLGYTVLEAENGEDALHVCSRYHGNIDLLLTDVVMPHLSGPQLVKEIDRFCPGIIVLYMSGYTEDAIVHHGVLKEEINFLHKPISPKDLAQTLRTLLAKQP
jgi:signal transduction histidine kinase/ActR/RegA family two-component response regulator